MLAKWIEGRDGNRIATWVPYIPENVRHRQPPEVEPKTRKKKEEKVHQAKAYFEMPLLQPDVRQRK